MNRRALLQGLVGVGAGLILPPTLAENVEAVRRYWALDRTMSGSTLEIRYGHPWSPFALTREPEPLRVLVCYPDGTTESHLTTSTPDSREPMKVRIARTDCIQGAALIHADTGKLAMTYGHVPFEAIHGHPASELAIFGGWRT